MNLSWMPLYVGDFLADTMHLNCQETGAYIRLLMHAWQHDGLIPDDNETLTRIVRCHPPHWPRLRRVVEPFFEKNQEAGSWTSKRLCLEMTKAKEISSKRKVAAQQMLSKRRASAQHMLGHPQSQRKKDAGAREAMNGKASALPASNQISRTQWEQILDSYKKFNRWHREAGPEPPSPACRCPRDLLAKYAITLAVRA